MRAVHRCRGDATGVKDLADDPAVVPPADGGESPEARDAVVVDHREAALRRIGLVHRVDLGHDHPHPRLGARLVVGDHRVAYPAVLRQGGVVPGNEDAVLDGEPADVDGREEIGERGHGDLCGVCARGFRR